VVAASLNTHKTINESRDYIKAIMEVVDGVFKELEEHDYPRNNHTYWYNN